MSESLPSGCDGAELRKLKRIATRARAACETEFLKAYRSGGPLDRAARLAVAWILARSLANAIANRADAVGSLELVESQEDIAFARRLFSHHVDPALIEELEC